jgi:hypothetical protein
MAGLTTLPGGALVPAAGGPLSDSVAARIEVENRKQSSDILDASSFDLKLDKSNILMIGPTGSGTYVH